MAFTFSWRRVVAAAALSMGISAGAHASDIHTVGTVSGWDIIIDQSLGFGCAMQSEFEGGALVRMGFNKQDGHGYIIVLSEDWSDIQVGQHYDIGMDLDGRQYTGNAEGFELSGMPGVYIPFDNSEFFVSIMKKHTLQLKHQGRSAIAISLAGTYNALEATMSCQEGVEQAR